MFFERETKKERERERVHPNGLEGALSLFCLVLNVRILCFKGRENMYILLQSITLHIANHRNHFDTCIQFIAFYS